MYSEVPVRNIANCQALGTIIRGTQLRLGNIKSVELTREKASSNRFLIILNLYNTVVNEQLSNRYYVFHRCKTVSARARTGDLSRVRRT